MSFKKFGFDSRLLHEFPTLQVHIFWKTICLHSLAFIYRYSPIYGSFEIGNVVWQMSPFVNERIHICVITNQCMLATKLAAIINTSNYKYENYKYEWE